MQRAGSGVAAQAGARARITVLRTISAPLILGSNCVLRRMMPAFAPDMPELPLSHVMDAIPDPHFTNRASIA